MADTFTKSLFEGYTIESESLFKLIIIFIPIDTAYLFLFILFTCAQQIYVSFPP